MQTSFTVKSAAEYIGVSRVWVRDAIRDGCPELGGRKLRANKKVRPWIVNPDDVETIRRLRQAGKTPRAPYDWNTSFSVLGKKLNIHRRAVDWMAEYPPIWLDGAKLNWAWGWRRAGPSFQWVKLVDPAHVAMLVEARNRPAPEGKIAAKSKGLPFPKYKHINRGLFNHCKKNSDFLGTPLTPVREPSLVDGIGHFLEFYDEKLIAQLGERAAEGAKGRRVDDNGEVWLTVSRAGKDGFGNRDRLRLLEQKEQLTPTKFPVLSESNKGKNRKLGVRSLKHYRSTELNAGKAIVRSSPKLPEILRKNGKDWASEKKARELSHLTKSGLYAAKDIPRIFLTPPGLSRQYRYFRADKCSERVDSRKTQWCTRTDGFGTWFPIPLAAQLAGEDQAHMAQYAWALSKGKIHKVPRRLRDCIFDLRRNQARHGHEKVWYIRGDSLNFLCRGKGLPEPWEHAKRSRGQVKQKPGRPPDPKVAAKHGRCRELRESGLTWSAVRNVIAEDYNLPLCSEHDVLIWAWRGGYSR